MKKTLNVIVMVGLMQGGKGTFTKSVVKDHREFLCFTSGDLVRYHLKHETPLGLLIADDVASGGYLSCETMAALSLPELSKVIHETDFLILDGYPRTEKQVEDLLVFLRENRPDFRLTVIYVNTPRAVCYQRQKKALEGDGDRSDRTDRKLSAFETRTDLDLAHIPFVVDSLTTAGAHVFHFDGTDMLGNLDHYKQTLFLHLDLLAV